MTTFHRDQRFELSLTQLIEMTGLSKHQATAALKPLVKAKILERVWSEDGRAVYRLKGKENES